MASSTGAARMTFDEFMARFNPTGEHEVINVAATEGSRNSPFIVVRDVRGRAVIINPLAFDDHLCIDLHSFIDGNDAVAGVFGMTNGREVHLPDTGATSHGWPATRLVAVLVGEQGNDSA